MLHRELVEQARQGNSAAWEELVRAYREPVFRLAYLMLGDADEAEDVAQETFIRTYAALSRLDPERPIQPWLLRVAANLSRNRRRSLRRYLAALQRSVVGTPLSAQIDESGAWEAHTLWEAVRRLPTADQEVIYLRYFLDLSEVEAAEASGVARGTVKSRTSRALARLRILIDRDFPALRDEREGLQ